MRQSTDDPRGSTAAAGADEHDNDVGGKDSFGGRGILFEAAHPGQGRGRYERASELGPRLRDSRASGLEFELDS